LEASYQNQKDEKKSERSCYIHTMLLEAKLGKKKRSYEGLNNMLVKWVLLLF
jgi:hypothetical protein